MTVAALLVAGLLASSPPPPEAVAEGGRLVLVSLPDLLAAEEVAPELSKGLTTTFAFEVGVADRTRRRASGGAQVAVRYELWDEVYLVAWGSAAGGRHAERFASFEELRSWWRGLRLPVLAASELGGEGPWRVEVELSMVPFSQAEQQDTQRWFSDSVAGSQGEGAAEEVTAAADDRPETLGKLLGLLMATSIERRSVASWRWVLSLEAAAAAAPIVPSRPSGRSPP